MMQNVEIHQQHRLLIHVVTAGHVIDLYDVSLSHAVIRAAQEDVSGENVGLSLLTSSPDPVRI